MSIVYVCVALHSRVESVAVTSKVKEPARVGVPEITPVAGSSARPSGRVPVCVKVYPVPGLAVMVCL